MTFEFINDVSKLEGTVYFEFLPRKYQGECWNSDAVYIQEEAILFFDALLVRHVPNYDHFSFMSTSYEAAQSLADDLLEYSRDVVATNNTDLLVQKYGVRVEVANEIREDWLHQRQPLSRMLSELASWIEETIEPGGRLSVLGI